MTKLKWLCLSLLVCSPAWAQNLVQNITVGPSGVVNLQTKHNSFVYFNVTLTANATTAFIDGGAAGAKIDFNICQDAVGARTWVWPPNFQNTSTITISMTASACTTAAFITPDGLTWNNANIGGGGGGTAGNLFGNYTVTNTAISSPFTGDLIVGGDVSNGATTLTAGSGYTFNCAATIGGTVFAGMEFKTADTSTTFTAPFTQGSSVAWAASIGVFQAANPAVVQSTCSSAAATSLAYGSSNGSGNLLVAVVRYNANPGGPITSITDTRSNTWKSAGARSGENKFDTNWIEVWYALNSAAGANTVTVTFNSGGNGAIALAEFSGVATTNALLDYNISGVGGSGNPMAGATTDPQFTYKAINGSTGATDCTGTDIAVVMNSCVLTNLNGVGGKIFFKNGIYNIKSMTQQGATAIYYGIGIPAAPTSTTGAQFFFEGENRTQWLGELGISGINSNGTIFLVNPVAMGTAELNNSNTLAAIFQITSGGAGNLQEDYFSDLCVRFPHNQTAGLIGIDMYNAITVSYENVLADSNLSYSSISSTAISAGSTSIGLTSTNSSEGNLQHFYNVYSVGWGIGYDIASEHFVADTVTSIYCINAGRLGGNGSVNHPMVLTKVTDQENSNGWMLAGGMLAGTHVDFVSYDIEAITSGPFIRVKNLQETNKGNTYGILSYVYVQVGSGPVVMNTPFGVANADGGDAFTVIYNGGIRGMGFAKATAQTATIAATALYAHPAANSTLYQVVWYLVTTTAGTGGTVSFTLTWNDGTAQTFTSGNLNLNAQGSLSGTVLVKANSGAVNYSTTVTGATGSPQYSIDVRSIPLG